MKYLPIPGNGTMPALGLGTWKSTAQEVGQAVSQALDIGYRHIDCAAIYQNQAAIGSALVEGMKSGRVKREELWVTSKLWNNAHRAKHVQPALEKTLAELRLDYLDLYLIHWPIHFAANIVFPRNPEEFLAYGAIPVMETWQAMERLVGKGMCRCIGVCNFNLPRLIELRQEAHIQPVMNQIELHPYLQQTKMVDYCRQNGLLLTAYSPLGSGDRPQGLKKADEPSLLDETLVGQIAEKNAMTPAQVLLVWGLARGTAVIPKSTKPARLRENLAAADLNLGPDDLAALDGLDRGYRFVDGAFFTGPGSPYTLDELWGED